METQYALAKGYTDGNYALTGIQVPAGATFTQIQAALTSAASFGTKVVAAGAISTTSTLVITSSCDLSGLTITYSGTGVAVQVGAGSGTVLTYKQIVLPTIVNATKTITGWSQVAGSVGVSIRVLNSCTVTVPRIRNFETGLEIRGEAAGCVYNTITLGQINNNKYGVSFTNDSTGWTNQNAFIGGAVTMDSAEGNGVSGTRAVMLNTASNLPNTNTFVGVSFEGNGWEYMVECFGLNNVFVNCRFEASLGARVYWRASATKNAILEGYGTITPTYETGAVRNAIAQTGARRNMTVTGTGGTFNLQNDTSASNSSLTVTDPAFGVEAGFDPATAYSWSLAATILHGKRGGDSNDRVQLDAQNGRLYFTNGATTPSYYLGNFGTSGMAMSGGHLSWAQDNTYDLGLASQRPKTIRAATAMVTGAFATGSRPTASSVGAGGMCYDTTLSKPIWSDGTTWRDAAGTAV